MTWLVETLINLVYQLRILKMRKIFKKFGNSIVIVFTKEEVAIYDIEVGDIVNFNLKHLSKKELEDFKK